MGPRLLITLGDVAGIGPEVVVKAWPELLRLCRPVVVGDAGWLTRTLEQVGRAARVVTVARPEEAVSGPDIIPCLPGSDEKLEAVTPGQVSAAAGKAAYDFLCRAIDATLVGQAEGIVTAPLHKEGL